MLTIALALAFVAGGLLGWRLGWNSACRMYRDRDIGRARERYQQDRK